MENNWISEDDPLVPGAKRYVKKITTMQNNASPSGEKREEGNKAIVEFLGGKYEVHPFLGEGYRFSGDDLDNATYGSRVNFLHTKSLCYDSNWNFLMAAAAKIKITIQPPTEEFPLIWYNNIFNGIISFFSCHLTFLEVVNFITWYNQQTPSNGK